MEIRLLAVDLAWSGPTGYALINEDFEILKTGIFKPHGVRVKDRLQNLDHTRAKQIYDLAIKLLYDYRPTHIYYETPDWYNKEEMGKSFNAHIGLTKAGSAFSLGCINYNKYHSKPPVTIPVPIGANKVKSTLCSGLKGKDKKQTAKALLGHYPGQVHFPLNDYGKPLILSSTDMVLTYDQTDALGIAAVVMSDLRLQAMVDLVA